MPATDDAPTFDLQSHSTCSDGALSPSEVVARAAAAGVEILALSDHDTVEGIDEAIDAGREHGVRIVPAVEISVLDDEREDLHLLGYCVDHHSPRLREVLALCRADRDARAMHMADALEANGLLVDRAQLEARRAEGGAIGRPHLARAVASHPGNAERLREQGLAAPGDTVGKVADAVLVAYLIPGRPAFVKRAAPTVAGAIGIVHEAGGLAVWAHPFWDVDADADVLDAIDRFHAAGLDGVEAFYVTHTPAQTRLVADRCAELGLLTTGSADFHGPDHPRFHTFRAFGLHGRTPNLGAIGAVTAS